ncbi:hypothetical protein V8C86DRAFT_2462263 [Haematococcus lacustris]
MQLLLLLLLPPALQLPQLLLLLVCCCWLHAAHAPTSHVSQGQGCFSPVVAASGMSAQPCCNCCCCCSYWPCTCHNRFCCW